MSFVLVLMLSPAFTPSRAAESSAVDAHGDPLPIGAAARLGTLRWRTGDFVNGLTWSADGGRIASAENGGEVRVWDAATGRPVCVLAGHREGVTGMGFSPDGDRLVTASKDSVRVWDGRTGKRLYIIPVKTRRWFRPESTSVAFTPDGKTVVVFGREEVIRFDASDATESGRFPLSAPGGHALSPRGDLVAVYRERGAIHLHDAATGALVHRLPGPGGQPFFAAEGAIVGAKSGESVVLWDGATGRRLCPPVVEGVGRGKQVLVTPRGKGFVGQDGNRLVLLDADGKRIRVFGPNGERSCAALSPDGGRLVAGESSRLRVWDVATGAELSGVEGTECTSLAFSPDGKRLLGGDADGSVRLWDVQARKVVRDFLFKGATRVDRVAFSPDGKAAAAIGVLSGGDGVAAVVWDANTGAELRRFVKPYTRTGGSPGLLFSPDSRVLFAITNLYSGVFRWDLGTGKELEPLSNERPYLTREMQFTGDGKTLAVLGYKRTALYDSSTGKPSGTLLQPFVSKAVQLRPSPDGKRMAFVSSEGQLSVVSTADGDVLRNWASGGNGNILRYSPDGKHLVAASHHLLRVRDADTGKASLPIVGDSGPLHAVEFSPDGRWMAAGGKSSAILLWDARVLHTPPAFRLSETEWEGCWEKLGTPGNAAFDAEPWSGLLLASGDEGVARSRARLASVDVQRLARLMREARPLLKGALDGTINTAQRSRVETILAELAPFDGDEHRAPRVVDVLRQVGTKAAVALLADMAAGEFGDGWQRAAKADSKR